MSITSKSLLDLLYNKKLPQIYRDEDRKIGYPLKRYLESLIDGGFHGSIEDIEGILLLIDPETIPEKFFPYLFESFGMEYHPDIDVVYQRKFLLNIGEFIKRRGTYSSIQFLIKVLTELEAELSLEGDKLHIVLLARNLNQVDGIETSMKVIENFVQEQLPYFVSPVIYSRIDTQVINSKSYSHSAIGCHKFYTISSIPPATVEVKLVNGLLVVEEPNSGPIVPELSNGLLVWNDVDVVVLEDGKTTFLKNPDT